MEQGATVAEDRVTGALTNDGKFVLYNILGVAFEIPAKYVPPICPIGRGGYGLVCSAVNSETNENVAIKKISHAFDNRIHAKRILREIKFLCCMDHENIIAVKDIIIPPARDNFNDVYIVSELMETDLSRIIRAKTPLTKEHHQYFLYQILRGLKYIHSANILHRDLKPSNLLVNANCDLKICDFGLARTTPATKAMTEYVVSRWYRAPELVLNCSEYTAAIDIWSVGCILMEMLMGEPLLPGMDRVQQLKLIIELLGSPDDSDLGFLQNENARKYIKRMQQIPKQPLPQKYSYLDPVAIDLVENMLVFDPSKRITVEEALRHPYLAHLAGIVDESSSPFLDFDFDFEQPSFPEKEIKELIYQQALKFHSAGLQYES